MTTEAVPADVRLEPLPASRRRRRGGYSRPGWLTYGMLGAVLLGSLFPLYWQFLIGSHEPSVLNDPVPPLLPGSQFWANAQRVFDTVEFWKALGNSIVISSVIALSVVLFSTLAGFAFAKLRFRGNGALMTFVVLTMAIPTQLGIIPLYILMAQLGWTGTKWAVIVPGLVSAFGVFWMRQYLEQALPYELIEAARVDGCSMIRVFWHTALPAARPAAAMLGTFTFILAWNDFMWPLIVMNPDNPTIQTAIDQLQAGYWDDYSLVMAGATLGTIPLLILFFFAGRQIVAGVMAGAVKG
jgi:cellobiose transport system permease protein